MNKYLETMSVDDLAIAAHEKGERENDTYVTIELDDKNVRIIKRSRVNADLEVKLVLGREDVELLPPGDRPKKMLATSDTPKHLRIDSSLFTVNGLANVTDTKVLLQEGDKSVLKQELTIVNKQSGVTNTTTRYFTPYLETPPHLVPPPAAP